MRDPLIGKQLDSYRIDAVLGGGGSTRVFRARDLKRKVDVALKVIDPALDQSIDQAGYVRSLMDQAAAIQALKHPNLVPLRDYHWSGGLFYFVMDLVEGKPLSDILDIHRHEGTRLTPAEMAGPISELAGALDYIHGQGLIHRNVKPANVMMLKDGHTMLLDFGLVLRAVQATTGNPFRNVHYTAPEQSVSSEKAVPQSDEYALAVIVYELMTGRVPFDEKTPMGITLKHLSAPPPPPRQFNPDLSKKAEKVVLKALAKKPEERYSSAGAFAKALAAAGSGRR